MSKFLGNIKRKLIDGTIPIVKKFTYWDTSSFVLYNEIPMTTTSSMFLYKCDGDNEYDRTTTFIEGTNYGMQELVRKPLIKETFVLMKTYESWKEPSSTHAQIKFLSLLQKINVLVRFTIHFIFFQILNSSTQIVVSITCDTLSSQATGGHVDKLILDVGG